MGLRKRISELAAAAAEEAVSAQNVMRTEQSTGSNATAIGQVLTDPDDQGNVTIRLATGQVVSGIQSTRAISRGDTVTIIGKIVL